MAKGFPDGEAPEWNLALAEDVLTAMQKISGDDSLAFEYPDQVHIKLTGKEETWAVVKTKEIESVEVTLAGPSYAIDLDQLAKLGIETELDLSDESNCLLYTSPSPRDS